MSDRREELLADAERIIEEAERSGWSDRQWREVNEIFDQVDELDSGGSGDSMRALSQMTFERRSRGGRTMSNDNSIRGWTPDGQEVRSFGPGESVYQHNKRERGYEDFWDELDIGRYLRAREYGARTEAEQRALDAGSAGAVIPQPLRDRVVDDLKEGSLLGKLRISTFPMESNTLDVARFDSQPSGAWLSEGSTFSSTDPSISSVQLNARTFRARVDVGRETFDDSVGLEDALRRAFRQEFTGALNDAVLVGNSGSTTEPTGIANTTDINTTDFGGSTDGVRPASSANQWDEVIRARQQLLDREVSADALEGVWSPKASRLFNSLQDANFQPLRRPPVIRELPLVETVSSPTTLQATTGSANVGMELTLGDFSNVVVGVRLDPEIRVIDAQMKDSWEMSFIAGARWDVQFLQPDGLERLRPITT